MGDSFLVPPDDLTKGSCVKVKVICDECGSENLVAWYSYLRLMKKNLGVYCCSSCAYGDAKHITDALHRKYGNSVNCISDIPGIQEKREKTNLQKYGCKNPSQSETIKHKIISSNIEKYGVPYSTQSDEVKKKKSSYMFRKIWRNTLLQNRRIQK